MLKRLALGIGAGCALLLAASVEAAPDPEPVSSGGPPSVRRLNEGQYRSAIADIFGPNITVDGRFENDHRAEGLEAIGSGIASVSASGAEYYVALAQSIASRALGETNRDAIVGCKPAPSASFDRACASAFIAKYGRMLFRRPLERNEATILLDLSRDQAARYGDFYSGLRYSLISMLSSPQFLFRIERNRGGELDSYSKASRLSFLLWNSTPDDELLRAAEKGDLDNPAGLRRQVDRLIASPRIQAGVSAFFSDMLHFGAYTTLTKDTVLYPDFGDAAARASRSEVLRLINDLLITQNGDYRDLFTTKETFLNRELGPLYNLPVVSEKGWDKVSLGPDTRRAGLLTTVSFLALHAHPGRSSPTLRGAAVRELLLCQPVPAPPGDVDFTLLQDTKSAALPTARSRLAEHNQNPVCAGCHKLMDPIGLALETFDGSGQLRLTENGVPIDTSGEYDGNEFKDAAELGKLLHDDPQIGHCLTQRLFSYGTGRSPRDGEAAWVDYLAGEFEKAEFRFPALVRKLATSPAFYRVDSSATKLEAR